MVRKSILVMLTLFTLLIMVACGSAAPQASQEAEVAQTEAVAEEATVEVVPTEAPAEEVAAESSNEGTTNEGEAVTYTVDSQASTVEWYGSKPIGKSESGTVAISEGQLTFNGTELVDGSFVIDMTSIDTTTQSGNMKQMLEDHLKSDEFFGIETYPTSALVIKSVEPTAVENQYTIVADLTIKETTDEITFVTDVAVTDDALAATAKIVVDRSIYDVRYASGSFFSDLGDDLISNEMELTVNLVAPKL